MTASPLPDELVEDIENVSTSTNNDKLQSLTSLVQFPGRKPFILVHKSLFFNVG